MAEPSIRLLVPGIPLVESAPEPELTGLLKVTPVSAHAIAPQRRGAAVMTAPVETSPDAIVRVEYESGIVEWLRADQFIEEIGPARGVSEVQVPTALNRGAGPSRGPADWVLKALHVFGVSPADALAQETAEGVVDHFESKLNTGLYRVKRDGSFGEKISSGTLRDISSEYLIFIHGTVSSTDGSFSGFWRTDAGKTTPEWDQLASKYIASGQDQGRILALEHRTLSQSPAQNALDLANLLPAGAKLHIITHSRGGLVGELLCLQSMSDSDLDAFKGRPDFGLLRDLKAALDAKNFVVSKFVRTACPAAGTILASKRLDLYLNLILNVIGHIPVLTVSPTYAIFKATALELIKLRADPTKIPGIEAQMPESPLIYLLNTKGRTSKADLGVIAGDFEGTGFWGALKQYAIRSYYWEQNDFVVNTRSMSGGMERAGGVWQFLDQGNTVNHFNYFANLRTRSHMLDWLNSPQAQPNADFARVRGIQKRGSVRGAADLPVGVLIPDVFGSRIGDVWLKYEALAAGHFPELTRMELPATEILQASLTTNPDDAPYKQLHERLAAGHDVLLFPYDWRKSVSELAGDLGRQLETKLEGFNRPNKNLHIVAHGMGGLIVRELARSNPQFWAKLCESETRVVMLGTPNYGSWQIARLLAGQSALVRMLALLGRQSDSDVARVLQQFQGLLDMLPTPMLDAKRWDALPFGRPDPDRLQKTLEWRRSFEKAPIDRDRMFYLAGSADATPSEMDQYTPDGDGHVTYALGNLPALSTWYSRKQHGDLPTEAGGVIEILSTGRTSSLETGPRPRASITGTQGLLARERAVFFPNEADLVAQALGAGQKPVTQAETVLRVSVAHGNLRESRFPVAVGHYVGDGIVSAEAQLDRALKSRLSQRFHMDMYPGLAGTAEVVRVPDAHPPGALIVGLGEVGDVTGDKVRRGVLAACLRYALIRAEEPVEPGGEKWHSAAITSLLIGVSGGRAISITDSVTSVVQGVIEANRVLRRRNLWDQVRIDEVQFIELYEEPAVEAAHAVSGLKERLQYNLEPTEQLDLDCILTTLPGGQYRRPMNDYSSGWWRRIQISRNSEEANRSSCSSSSTELTFTSLTDRARAEETPAKLQTKLIDALLEDATSLSTFDRNSSVALFELLVPNAIKDQAEENASLVLVLDSLAAHYPWELMSERRRESPLALEMGMLRQFKTMNFTPNPRAARDRNALVIGDTVSNLPALPGAQAEARSVGRLLSAARYHAGPLIRQRPTAIIRELFANEYRIMHLAGHGIYNATDPANSGMVLAEGVYLTPLELGQLRNLPELVFINCCHLGEMDQLAVKSPTRMAASVSEKLIQMGVKAVVAAGWAVDDAAAVAFAEAFYRHMLSGQKFGEAVRVARNAAYGSGATNTWGAYQCYGNPDFVLNLEGTSNPVTPLFCSKRECIEELRDIAAQAKGADTEYLKGLAKRAADLDLTIASSWRDAELLSALGDTFRDLNDFATAIQAYESALAEPEAKVPIKTVEQLANVLDRRAKQLDCDPNQKAEAAKLWNRAEKLLNDLIGGIGPSDERYSLLGALWKRRGDFSQAARYYGEAYKLKRSTRGVIDLYSGINWVQLAYVSGTFDETLKDVADECMTQASRRKTAPTFWDRVGEPDWLVTKHLLDGDLDSHVDEAIAKYQSAFQHAAANERDSVCAQLRFIQRAAKSAAGGLQRIIDNICS